MAELFKFRCYQCSKLLGASPSKIGTIVKCPKCAAELVVPPPPDLEDSPAQDEPIPEPVGGGIRLESLGLRLESEPEPEPEREVPGQPLVARPPSTFAASSEPEELLVDVSEKPRGRTQSRSTAPSILQGAVVPRRNDVLLPRTAVVAWSMATLAGLAFAFASGMLIGHYLWR